MGLWICAVASGVVNTLVIQATNNIVTEPVAKIIKNHPPGVMITSLFFKLLNFCCFLRRVVTAITPRVTANHPPYSLDRPANGPVFSDRLNKILTAWRMKTAYIAHSRFYQTTYGYLVDSHHKDKNTGQEIIHEWNDCPHIEHDVSGKNSMSGIVPSIFSSIIPQTPVNKQPPDDSIRDNVVKLYGSLISALTS